MKEKKARVEDALHSTRAAVEEGVVPGGGVTLVRATRSRRRPAKGDNADQDVGIGIATTRHDAHRCVRLPANAGAEGSVVLDKVKWPVEGNQGFNAATE